MKRANNSPRPTAKVFKQENSPLEGGNMFDPVRDKVEMSNWRLVASGPKGARWQIVNNMNETFDVGKE